MTINSKLAEERGVSIANQAKIEVRHTELDQIRKQMEQLDPSVGIDREQLKVLAESVTRIEYELQELWGFEKDSRYHWWFNLPHCTCPKMDNRERMGTSSQVMDYNCIYHGGGRVLKNVR